MKVIGFIPEGKTEKSYKIIHGGRTFVADRCGRQFQCGAFVGTLKEIREEVAKGHRQLIPGYDPPPEPDEAPAAKGAYDCIHPVAMLVKYWYATTRHPCTQEEIRETLDCYGWICKETNFPDLEAADREIARFRKYGVANDA